VRHQVLGLTVDELRHRAQEIADDSIGSPNTDREAIGVPAAADAVV
jgi:hypothetical protein